MPEPIIHFIQFTLVFTMGACVGSWWVLSRFGKKISENIAALEEVTRKSEELSAMIADMKLSPSADDETRLLAFLVADREARVARDPLHSSRQWPDVGNPARPKAGLFIVNPADKETP